MSKKALCEFYEEQMEDARKSGVMFSLHVKATMMKVSHPIVFGHAVRIFYKEAFAKHGKVFEELGINVNNGMVDLEEKIETLPHSLHDEIVRDLHACHEHRPDLAMVDSAKGITNLHAPSDNGLSLSFNGSITYRDLDEGNNCDINLKKVIATTADYKCTTAVLNVRDQDNFHFDAMPKDNYSQVTVNYFDELEPIMMRAANIITITNRDGAYIDADNGADKITGNTGSDVIKGGAGKDIINGGTTFSAANVPIQTGGADLFVYGRETAGYIKSTSVDSNNIIISPALRDLNRDTIADFKPGEDQIGIDAREIGWSEAYRGVDAITEIMPSQFKIFAAGTTFPTTGTGANGISSTAPLNQGVTTGPFNNSYLMLVLGATSSTLYIDLDAGGIVFSPVALATLTGVTTTSYLTAPMTNTDFLLLG